VAVKVGSQCEVLFGSLELDAGHGRAHDVFQLGAFRFLFDDTGLQLGQALALMGL
jgi:hypothetical protein